MPPTVKSMPLILAPQYSLDTDARFPAKLLLTGGQSGILRNLIVWYGAKINRVLCRLLFKIKA
jgi:hypothetical protein